jgi:hypothetical protein
MPIPQEVKIVANRAKMCQSCPLDAAPNREFWGAMRAKKLLELVAAVTLMAWCGHALAEGASGTVIAVVQQANIDGKTGKLVIEPQQPVFSGDKIQTGPLGQAQIIFQDKTKLVVGPNSSMTIDAFVFENDNTAKKFSINVLKGAFRFITGSSPKDAYQITTPTATIGVRGTEFDIAIEKEGTTRVANFEGMTHICRRTATGQTDNCVDVKEPCSLSIARPQEPDIKQLSNKDIEYRNRQLKYYFPYIRSQAGLLKDFQVNLAECKFAGEIPPGGGNPIIGPGSTPEPVIPPSPQAPETMPPRSISPLNFYPRH